MEIRKKISLFMENEKIEVSQIAQKSGKAQPTISNYINGKREIPLSFLIWLIGEYKIIDPRKLFDNSEDIRYAVDKIVAEDREEYGKKKEILIKKISDILDEFGSIKYYFLDSQIPDILRLSKQEKYRGKFIIRVSDYETLNYNFLSHCQPEFIWVDYNFSNFDNSKILAYIKFLKDIDSNEYLSQNGIKKILVSPELYGLQNINITSDIIKITNKELLKKYSICTKLPDDWRKIV